MTAARGRNRAARDRAAGEADRTGRACEIEARAAVVERAGDIGVAPDRDAGALYACTNNWVYGASFHRSDDVSIVVLLNKDPSTWVWMKSSVLGDQLNAAADAISTWPSGDQFPAMGIPSF